MRKKFQKKNPTGLPGSCLRQPGWNCFLFMDEANETVCFVRRKEKFVMTPVSELTPSISVCLRLDLRPGLAWSLSEFPGLNKHSCNKDCLFATLMLLISFTQVLQYPLLLCLEFRPTYSHLKPVFPKHDTNITFRGHFWSTYCEWNPLLQPRKREWVRLSGRGFQESASVPLTQVGGSS